MDQPEPNHIANLLACCLQQAIRERAIAILQAEGELAPFWFREVERLMRMAEGVGDSATGGSPKVYLHNAGVLPPQPGIPPEILPVDLADLLAARAADWLSDAASGDPAARRRIVDEARTLLETEEIQIS